MSSLRFLSVLFFILTIHNLAKAQSHYPGQHQGKMTLPDKTPMKAYSFNLQDVRLLPGMFKDNMTRESAWILSIDIKRSLHSFRNNAGVMSGNEGGYFDIKKLGGWESLDCDLRGHTTGHILSGLAMLYGSTGDEVYKLKADSLVKGLSEVQEALHQDGYLSAYSQGLIDRNIAGQRVWAPWYTLHKIYAGLIDQYLYCDNQLALQVVSKMTTWAYNKLKPLSAEQRTKMLRNEFGGMNDVFYNMYAITGKPEHKWLAEFFYHDEMLNPLLKQDDILEKKHANTFIPKLIGLTRNYEITGNDTSKLVAEFFLNTVIDHHTFCTGSNSDKEKFFKPDNQSVHLTGYTGESCNVYNLLKLSRHLFCADADVKYADYYERALFNHILGQQDPSTGMVAYFLPMLAGAHKVYSTRDSSFWCCVGTAFESQAKFGEAIYYHTDNALYVNLFIASELNWKDKGVKVRQETQFPNSEATILTVETPHQIDMPILVRYPAWATSGAKVKINGKAIKIEHKPGSYIILNCKWNNGDKIEIAYPMSLRMVPSDNDSIVALAYGPVVLAGVMGAEGMVSPALFSNPQLYNDYYTYDFRVPANLKHTLKLGNANLNQFIKPVTGGLPLTFKTINEGITLEPLYRIHRQRYVVYWNVSR